MDNDEFERFLNKVAEWRPDCDPRWDEETQAFPRVIQIKQQLQACDFCPGTCTEAKRISYSFVKQAWIVSCRDCDKKHIIPVSLSRKYK